MKKASIILVAVAVCGLVIANIPQSDAYTWYNNRNTVTIPSYTVGNGWINASLYYGSWVSSAGENMSANWSMPTPLNESNSINMKIYNNGSGPIHCNLTVNGHERVNNSTTINAGIEFNVAFDTSLYPQDYLNITFNANSTDVFLNISINWVDATVTKTEFITGVHGLIGSIQERYKTHPKIKFDKDASYYVVEDKITIRPAFVDTNNWSMEIYDVNFTIQYPSNAINSPVSKIYVDYLNLSSPSETHYIGYQKYGPYVSRIGTPSQDPYGDYELGMRVYAYEDEEDCSWEFDPESSDLSSYFPSLDYDTLTIEINGIEYNFTRGSITISDIDLDEGQNTVEFQWTPEQVVTPVTPTERDTTLWLIGAGILIVGVVLVALIFIKRK